MPTSNVPHDWGLLLLCYIKRSVISSRIGTTNPPFQPSRLTRSLVRYPSSPVTQNEGLKTNGTCGLGNFYSISNETSRPARVFFSQGCVPVDAEIDGA
jgi:hypothetical protein